MRFESKFGRNTRGDRISDKNRENLPKNAKREFCRTEYFATLPLSDNNSYYSYLVFRIFAKFRFLILSRARVRANLIRYALSPFLFVF